MVRNVGKDRPTNFSSPMLKKIFMAGLDEPPAMPVDRYRESLDSRKLCLIGELPSSRFARGSIK